MSGLTPKQESFAQAVASGKSQADAYRLAYNASKSKPETIHSKASVLMADGKVAARVAELRKPIAEKAQMTLESHLLDLKTLSDKAAQEKQFSAAITAEIARGKASGVHVEKTEQTVTMTATLDISKLSKGTLLELMEARRAAQSVGMAAT